ncbi:MAG: FdtA/QdtA family cupin domain-containing protein [Ginsengibacter sp.]
MATLITLEQYKDLRGGLTVIEKQIPFEIKRIFFIEGAAGYVRGGHRHKKTVQAMVCLSGTCKISNDNGTARHEFDLDASNKCLILDPADWHVMHSFSDHAILLVLASTVYDVNDYIDEPYSCN